VGGIIMAYVTNPFQSLELRIPEAYRDEVDRFCQTQPGGGTRPSPDESPFERQIDIWFLAVCIGARKGKRTRLVKPHRFIWGDTLSRDPFRIELLELVAISYTNDPWILENPSEIMDLANELAATGLPEIIEMLKGGNAKPIWNLTDNLAELFPAT
jgi:hypothetical protein